jgi:hypothetical protein
VRALSLIRTPTDEPGRRWSYHRALWINGTLAALCVWRGSPYTVQSGALFILAGVAVGSLGSRRAGLYLAIVGMALLIPF